jgi:hypothetical protein
VEESWCKNGIIVEMWWNCAEIMKRSGNTVEESWYKNGIIVEIWWNRAEIMKRSLNYDEKIMVKQLNSSDNVVE